MKTCTKCKEPKSLSEFNKSSSKADGIASICRECYRAYPQREYVLSSKYGISVLEFESLLSEQDGVCAICKKPAMDKQKGRIKNLCVDHDHKTGEVRGLLCSPCNKAIGLLEDDIRIVSNVIQYLKK